jgi:hypothetical protein
MLKAGVIYVEGKRKNPKPRTVGTVWGTERADTGEKKQILYITFIELYHR